MNNLLLKEKEFRMRYRMSSRDVFYGGGIVNGARTITYMGDLMDRVMTALYGNTGRCTEIEKIRLYNPVHAGDYMEFVARVVECDDKKAKIECRAFKIAVLPDEPEFPSSIDVLKKPIVAVESMMIYESK